MTNAAAIEANWVGEARVAVRYSLVVKRPPPSRAALLRYAAFQLPGIGLAAGLSFAAWEWFAVPAWAALAALALWVTKDAVLARFVAHAYEGHARGGVHDLVGKRGVAETELAPSGTVRIRAERWRAECAPGVERIAAGAAVRVVEVDGLMAWVAPA
jgi:membrane protein implicated in regulation of membrane protease activity